VSADGARVAFVRSIVGQSPEVRIANRDGGGARDLSNHAEIDHHPALSPDGGRVAFASWRDGSSDIWMVSADGTGLVNLTPAPDPEEGGPADAFPAWSPDGQWLAYRQVDYLTGETDIAVVRSTGGAVQVIELAGDQLGPAWSPDGRRIAFIHPRRERTGSVRDEPRGHRRAAVDQQPAPRGTPGVAEAALARGRRRSGRRLGKHVRSPAPRSCRGSSP
jgi:Tol biopolymer transport system component